MPIPYQPVHLPFSQKLREDADPALLTDGFTVITNGSFHRSGAIERRRGTELVAGDTTNYGVGNSLEPDTTARIHAVNDRVVTVTSNGVVLEVDGLTPRHVERTQISEVALRLHPVSDDETGSTNISSPDSVQFTAQSGAVVELQAWIRSRYSGFFDLEMRVINTETGAVIYEQTVVDGQSTGTSALNCRVIKRQVNGTYGAYIACMRSNGVIERYLVTVGSSVTVAAAATIRNVGVGAANTRWDICPFPGDVFRPHLLIATDNANVYIDKWDVSGPSNLVTYALATPTGLSVDYGDSLIWVIDSAGGVVTARNYTTAGAASATPQTLAAANGVAHSVLYHGSSSGTGAAAFTWTIAEAFWYTFLDETLPSPTSYSTFGWRPASHAFRWKGTPDTKTRVYILLESIRDNVGVVWVELVPDGARPVPGSRLRAVASLSPADYDQSVSNTTLLSRPWDLIEGQFEGNSIALRRSLQAVQFGVFYSVRPDKFDAVVSSNALAIAGGCVSYYDGKGVAELGWVQTPYIETAAENTGGSLTPSSTYKYYHTFAWYDANGQLHRSALSNLKSVTLTGAGTAVDLEIMPLGATMRQLITSQPVGRARYEIWRTTANGDVYYLLAHEEFTPSTGTSTNWVAHTDTEADGGITSNEILYTTGGEGQHDPVYGGASAVELHKSRLWAGGGAEGDLLWYSDEYAFGSPPNFNLFRQLRIPGHRVTALASLDDTLIAFTEHAIFAIYGDGPASNNDPATGSFAIPVPVSSDTGCLQPKSVVRGRDGIYFRGRQGLYLLDRSRQVTYLSEALELTLEAYPYTQGGACLSSRGEIRWLISEREDVGAGQNSRVLLYDTDGDQWSVWDYQESGPTVFSDIASNAQSFWLATWNLLPYLSVESDSTWTDSGIGGASNVYYPLVIETGQVSFGDWQTQKRIRRARIVFDRDGTDGIQLEHARNGSAYEETHTWTDLSSGAIRAHIKRQKGSRYQWRVTSVAPSPTTGADALVISGLSFDVGSEGLVERNPKTESD